MVNFLFYNMGIFVKISVFRFYIVGKIFNFRDSVKYFEDIRFWGIGIFWKGLKIWDFCIVD